MASEEPKKRGKGRPPVEIPDSKIDVIFNLAQVGCTLDMIAHQLEICPKTLDRMIERDQRIKDAVNRGRTSGNLKVLQTGFQMASNGKNPWMTSFWMRCKLGWKEPRDENPADEQKTFEMNYKK